MASVNTSSRLRSIDIGSDELDTRTCPVICGMCANPCERLDESSYCYTCEIALCVPCLHRHKESTISRQHNVSVGVNSQNDPGIPEKLGEQQELSSELSCETHDDRTVQLYCHTHDSFFCRECAFIKHRKCVGLVPSSEITGNAAVTPTVQELKAISTKTEKVLAGLKRCHQETEESKQSCFRQIRSFRESVQKLLYDLEIVARSAVQKETETFKSTLQKHEHDLNTLSKATDRETRHLEQLQRRNNVKQLRESLKENRTESLRRQLSKVEEMVELKVLKHDFEGHSIVTDILTNIQSLGTILTRTENVSVQPTFARDGGDNSRQLFTYQSLTFKSSCNAKSSQDTETPEIRGGCFLQDGRLILCDSSNRKLKLFDPSQVLQSCLCMPSSPWDVCVSNSDEVVVTMPGNKSLALVKTGHQLVLTRQIPLYRKCWGVAVQDHVMYVSCHNYNESEVLCVNFLGEILRSISLPHTQGSTLRPLPYYLAMDRRGQGLFLSCTDYDSIIHLPLDGRATKELRFRDIVKPKKVVVDSQGTILICGRDSNTVHKVSSDGLQSECLLTSESGLRSPHTIFLRETDNILVVAMAKSNDIKTYIIV